MMTDAAWGGNAATHRVNRRELPGKLGGAFDEGVGQNVDWISLAELEALVKVVLVDLVLAGDNAIVVGMAAAALPAQQRARVMVLGVAAATVLRILFASFTVQLLQVGYGLVLAGGLLLLWVCWKLWRELRAGHLTLGEPATADGASLDAEIDHAQIQPKTMRQAVTQIIIADVSMSLDNVLAVAGAAREHVWVLVFGLVLSVAFMGLAAGMIARLLARHHWIGYVGLAVILYVAIGMIYEGFTRSVLPAV